jgi:hypothetical protein
MPFLCAVRAHVELVLLEAAREEIKLSSVYAVNGNVGAFTDISLFYFAVKPVKEKRCKR